VTAAHRQPSAATPMSGGSRVERAGHGLAARWKRCRVTRRKEPEGAASRGRLIPFGWIPGVGYNLSCCVTLCICSFQPQEASPTRPCPLT
jgi:hypothetical protein